MRRSAFLVASLVAALAGLVSGQTSSLAPVATNCTVAPTCPTTGVESVPAPWFGLTFATAPSTASAPNFGWESAEAGDALCTYRHSGIATFNASLAQYVDLNAPNASSPLWGGAALPGYLGGASAGTLAAGTAGWTIESTFRAHPNAGNSKLFSIGAGQPTNNVFAGPDGSGTGMTFGIYDGNTNGGVAYSDGHSGIIEWVNPFVPYQWYHTVFVMQQVTVLNGLTDSGASATQGNVTHGAWWLYVNGALLSYSGGVSQNNMLPAQVPRQLSYLAKSSWNDPAFSGLIDTFRIYNQALTQSQVTTLYNGEMGGCAVPIATTAPAAAFPNLLPRTTSGAVTPFYSLSFTTNPGSGTGYGWVNALPTDSAANQALHQGLITLSSASSQFINMSASSGANSVGSVLPTIGGGTAGWSFEVMFLSMSGADSWPKLFDIGTTRLAGGPPLNDIVLGWDGSAGSPDYFWQFDVVDNTSTGHEFQTGDAIGELPYNTWTHVVATISPPTTNGNANYFVYVNGQLYTTITNVFYPVAAQRQNAFLGKSGWSDPYFNGSIDFFNVYNQQLSDTQIAALYQATLVPGGSPTQPSTGGSTGSTVRSSSSSSTATTPIPAASSSSSSSTAAVVVARSSSSSSTTPSPAASSSSSSAFVSSVTALPPVSSSTGAPPVISTGAASTTVAASGVAVLLALVSLAMVMGL